MTRMTRNDRGMNRDTRGDQGWLSMTRDHCVDEG